MSDTYFKMAIDNLEAESIKARSRERETYARLCAMEQERDRYRKALERLDMYRCHPVAKPDCGCIRCQMADIAREALNL